MEEEEICGGEGPFAHSSLRRPDFIVNKFRTQHGAKDAQKRRITIGVATSRTKETMIDIIRGGGVSKYCHREKEKKGN